MDPPIASQPAPGDDELGSQVVIITILLTLAPRPVPAIRRNCKRDSAAGHEQALGTSTYTASSIQRNPMTFAEILPVGFLCLEGGSRVSVLNMGFAVDLGLAGLKEA